MPVADSLAFATIRMLGKKLRAGEFTCVELAEFFLRRVEKIGPKLNAVVTVVREPALKDAAGLDAELKRGKDRGPLHGIPYGAKDLLATKGIRTTWGAAPLKEQMIDGDATVIQLLRRAGAVLIAKLAMIELAGGLGYEQADATFTGPGLNPWDTKRWSGGSSSGSGSAVGGGLVPFAIGSETWGSIITPAAMCGVTGFRPTYGRVSRHGAMALSWTMDKLGPLGRTADDCGLVLNAIAGPDPQDPSSAGRPYRYPDAKPAKPPFKLAVLKGATDKIQSEIKANFAKSLEELRKIATVEEIALPGLPYTSVASLIIASEMGAAFEGLVKSGDVWEMTAKEDRTGLHASLVIPAVDYINAMRVRAKIQRALDPLFARFDAVVTPTLASVAYPIGKPWRDYTRDYADNEMGGAENVAGLPGITVPNGFGESGLPTGLRFTARAFEENRLLAVAAEYQNRTSWHDKHP